MKALYFDSAGVPREKDFPFYADPATGGPVTALLNESGKPITQASYDAAIQALKTLNPDDRKVVARQAEHMSPAIHSQELYDTSPISKLTPERQKQISAAMEKAGLQLTSDNIASIIDHTYGGALRKEGVFDVGGQAMRETKLTRENAAFISMRMGGNMYTAGRVERVFRDARDQKDLVRGLQQTVELPSDNSGVIRRLDDKGMATILQSPLTQQLIGDRFTVQPIVLEARAGVPSDIVIPRSGGAPEQLGVTSNTPKVSTHPLSQGLPAQGRGAALAAAVTGIVVTGAALAGGSGRADAAEAGGKAALDTLLPGASDGFKGIRGSSSSIDSALGSIEAITGPASIAPIPIVRTAAAVTGGAVGTARNLMRGDLNGAAKSAISATTILASAETGATVFGSVGGPYAAIAGGVIGGLAAAAGFDAITNLQARPIELTQQQHAFYAFVDGLPSKPDAQMGPELKSLVEAKAGITQAQTQLDAATRNPQSANPGAARNALEAAENGFTDRFAELEKSGGLRNAVNELTTRNNPEIAPPATDTSTQIASMGNYKGRGQDMSVLTMGTLGDTAPAQGASNLGMVASDTNPGIRRPAMAAGPSV